MTQNDLENDSVCVEYSGMETGNGELGGGWAEEVAALDGMNMTAVLGELGTVYDAAGRQGQVRMLLEHGAVFLTEKRGGVLAGYLQFIRFPPEVCARLGFPEGTLEVGSLQVHPFHRSGAVLRCLIRRLVKATENPVPSCIRSVVQPGNEPSLRFHRKLGFTEFRRNERMVDLRISGQSLFERLGSV